MTEEPAVYNPAWQSPTGNASIDALEMTFINPNTRKSLAQFDPIIIFGGTLAWVEKGSSRETEAVKREREIFNALESGKTVCITFLLDELAVRVLERIGKDFEGWEKARVDFVIKRSEFSAFLKNFGSAYCGFYSKPFYDVICETENEMVVGFTEKVGKGTLIFLPCHVLTKYFTDWYFIKEFLPVLLDGLRTYLPRIQYKPPNWIDSYKFPNEAIISSKKEKLEREIETVKDSLDGYLRLKEILWFRNNELVNSVMKFFNEMGIQTKRDEIYEEDFWIMEQNKETVIVEVKGLDKNLKRPHISKLDEHRGAREKPDDFPALLVVNSFNNATSLKEKDVSISANEIKKAVRTNVLILRTLDLCNAYSSIERKEFSLETLLKLIKSESGWLNITTSGYRVKKE